MEGWGSVRWKAGEAMRTPEEIRAIRVLAKAMATRALAAKAKGSEFIRDLLVNDADEIKLELAREVTKAFGMKVKS